MCGGICQWDQIIGSRLFQKKVFQRKIAPAHPIRPGSLGVWRREFGRPRWPSKLGDREALPWLISCTISSMGAELVMMVVDAGSLIQRYEANGGEVRVDPRWCRPTWYVSAVLCSVRKRKLCMFFQSELST